MKLSFYFVVSFVIIYGFVNVHYEQPEFALTMAIIPVAMLQIILSAFFTRRENRFGMTVTIVSPKRPSSVGLVLMRSTAGLRRRCCLPG